MQTNHSIFKKLGLSIVLTALTILPLGGCGGGGSGVDGPNVEANPQTISFGAAPPLALGGSATISATASSGLAVSYSSTTPSVCSVNRSTGVITDIAVGTCVIAANQSGNSDYAPAPQVTQSLPVIFDANQTISFGAVPILTFGGTANVSATASSGLAVRYRSTTPTVCSVDSTTGHVTDLLAGACIIAANQAGDANFNPAPQVTQAIIVAEPSGITVPGAPTGVTATVGDGPDTVKVTIGATDSGGSPITGYTVTGYAFPGYTVTDITATGVASPITVTCPGTCSGYAFSVVATNSVGHGAPSTPPADVKTNYNVVETFYEPDNQPNNSIFIGSYTFNSTTGTVSNLRGTLSESMTGGLIPYPNDTMNWLPLNNQLSSVGDAALGGLLTTSFLLSNTNTLSNTPALSGTDGWAPGSGSGLYYGYPGANPGNAYARIFVNLANPTAAPTQAQIDKLAYADCAEGGMMGDTCMTGTTEAGYGSIGTMSGYPVSQLTTKQSQP